MMYVKISKIIMIKNNVKEKQNILKFLRKFF